MKKTKYLVWMLAAGLMAGCSDDLETGGGTGGALDGETGYVKVAINLPTSTGFTTRADEGLENDNFDDGTANEYQVNDVYLLIFQGKNEGSAVFRSAYDMNLSWNEANTPEDDNVTSRKEYIQEITKPASDDPIYALAIVNPTDMIDISVSGALSISGSPVTTFLQTLNKISNTSASAFIGGSAKNSFMMTNSPIAAKPGNDVPNQNVTTLVPVTIYESKEAADMDNTKPDEIYVERVVAKVSVATTNFTEPAEEGGRYSIAVDEDGSFYDGDVVYMDGWYLNVTNKSTKLVRDVSGWDEWATYANPDNASSTNNRFFGTEKDPYRVYWAVDGNYDNISSDEEQINSEFNCHKDADPTYLNLGDVDYCLENTFNTMHMKQEETTGIVFKMSYSFDPTKPNETFYMIEREDATYGLSEDYVEESNNIEKQINARLSKAGKLYTIKVNTSANGGNYDTAEEIKELLSKVDGEGTTDLTDDEITEILSLVNGGIKVYKDGTTYYYAARIKHFGDYYTPLPAGQSDVDGDVSNYDEEKHLGRYGVVRNNWYEIVIGSISGPGLPERPTTPPPTPDDDENAWVNVAINVLSWAKRVQNVDL